MPSYTVTGACPVEVDGAWREPGDHFATESDVVFLVGIGAVTEEGVPAIGSSVPSPEIEAVPARLRDITERCGELAGDEGAA